MVLHRLRRHCATVTTMLLNVPCVVALPMFSSVSYMVLTAVLWGFTTTFGTISTPCVGNCFG